MTGIAVSSVASASPSQDLWGAALDSPVAGDSSPAVALDIVGWALGRREHVSAVEVIHERDCLRRVPPDVSRPDLAERFPDAPGANSAGFFATVGALWLPHEFELLVRARLEDRTRVPIATLRGSRAPLETGFEPSIQPLMVTTLGRTGSTALVRMLAAHPQIAAYRPFEYEPRVASYWMSVLRGLSDPASYRRQLAPTGPIDGSWWLGTEPPLPRRIRDPELGDWLGGEAVRETAEFCQARIDGLYRRVATLQQRDGARYFAEKQRPDFVPALMWELHPVAREVILVRDFRDMVSSMFAFNEKRGFAGFRRGAAASDVEFVEDRIGNSVRALARAFRERAGRAHLVRYEDLVLRPAETVGALLAYLDLDDSPANVERMAATVTDRAPESDGHRTMQDPSRSIGRWREDLSEELQAACETAFAEALRIFGYETSVAQW
jgi:Sulfotransferase family